MKVYMINFFHHDSISKPSLDASGILSDDKFLCHFSFFFYTF